VQLLCLTPSVPVAVWPGSVQPIAAVLVATWLLGELRFLRDRLWGPA